jgi:hypothetical protein
VVQPEPAHDEALELRYIAPETGRMQRQWYRDGTALADAACLLSQHSNVYFGVALRRAGGRGTKADCTRVGALWADIDAKLWAEDAAPLCVGPEHLGAARAAVEAFWLPAGALVCSAGGYHVYWALAEPADVRDERTRACVERLNRALGRAVCGPERQPDHVHDVARILRLPGTLNYKMLPPRPVTVVWLHPERVYSLDGIAVALEQHAPWALRTADDAADGAARDYSERCWTQPEASTMELRERAAAGPIRRATLALLDVTGAVGRESASEADAALAAGLLRAGLTMDETLVVILDSARGQDAYRRARKGERWGLAYWQRTVANAADLVGPVTVRSDGRRVRPVRLAPRGAVTMVRPQEQRTVRSVQFDQGRTAR